ncbi:MAG: glycogen debranching enzyme, partial [Lachnospiraceae bacterium]
FSFKGFDNNIYYMLTPDGHYYNFSGCGNTLNCNHPMVQQLILECLRYWVTTYRVDGFRFDLASILGRNEDGSPMSKPPLLQSLAFDPILGNVKLIAEAWDAGGLYQVGTFPSWQRWAEWNGRYRDDMRQFLKGDYWLAEVAAQRISGSPDLYDPAYRGHNASVNFLTCHDGFSMYDLYSYNEKHNLPNGWNNTDGSNDNYSWNCGIEGNTSDSTILSLRHKLIKNAFTVLLCSRGTPMFLSGDEFGDTRFGNNNPYCQDNEISWLNWNLLETNQWLFDFVSSLIHFRRTHHAIEGHLPPSQSGFSDVSIHDTLNPKVVCTLFAGYDSKKKADDIIYLATNVYWEPQEIVLPLLPNDLKWYIAINTGVCQSNGMFANTNMPIAGTHALLGERSVMVFVAQ